MTVDNPIAAAPSRSNRGDQRLTDLKYRWPARSRASWAALLLGIVVHYADSGTNVWLLALAALGVSALLSLVNGVLIVVLRLNALIVTLATVGILTGLIQL